MTKTIILVRNTPSGSSVFPISWDTTLEDAGWLTLYPQGREARPDLYLHACLMATSGTRNVYVACAPNQIMEAHLTTFAAASPNAWTLAELKADNSVLATRLKQEWRTTVSGTIEFNQSMTGHTYQNNLLNND